MTTARAHLHKDIEKALNATGLPWQLENGSRHWKIRLAGRLAGIVSKGRLKDIPGNGIANTVSQIRRTAKELGSHV